VGGSAVCFVGIIFSRFQQFRANPTAFSLLVYTEQPVPTVAFPQNRGPQHASLLGWKKSRTSLNLTV
jgi:hypothetical protein